MKDKIPNIWQRIFAVWKRHIKVYVSNPGNSFPPIFEPLIFIIGIGLGLGKYIGNQIEGMPYIEYLIPGLAANVAMWTATFECTYGTFIRLNYEKVYHPMASTPVNVEEVFLGEILFTGTKGFIFTAFVVVEMLLLGYIDHWLTVFIPLVGFVAGMLFGAIAILITSLVKSMNTLNFYNSGVLSPMLFLSGAFFPVTQLPEILIPVSFWVPLTHVVNLMRSLIKGTLTTDNLISLAWLTIATILFSFLAIWKIKKKVIV